MDKLPCGEEALKIDPMAPNRTFLLNADNSLMTPDSILAEIRRKCESVNWKGNNLDTIDTRFILKLPKKI